MTQEELKNVKLKDFLNRCIEDISDEYIASLREPELKVYSALIQKHREMLLTINEICKSRNKY